MVTYKELMIKSLSDLLDENETLLYPVYGGLLQNRRNWFGYFGLTEKNLLIALLQGNQKEISWVSKVPLYIKKAEIKEKRLPKGYTITIEFTEGNPFKARISKKVFGFDCQQENVEGFIDYLKNYEKQV